MHISFRDLAEGGAVLTSVLAVVFALAGLPLITALGGAILCATVACGLAALAMG